MRGVTLLFLLSILTMATGDSRHNFDHRKNPDNQNIKLVESDRVIEYNKRNYTWPLQNYMPNTPGWKRLVESRFAQVAEMADSGKRYEGYIQTLHSAFLVPNFTEHGFGLARCPDDLIRDLRKGIRDGLDKVGYEPQIPVIEGPRPWFVDRPDLTKRVLHELRNYAEAWSGVELTPYRAYGFRLYRNESALWMHGKCSSRTRYLVIRDAAMFLRSFPLVLQPNV